MELKKKYCMKTIKQTKTKQSERSHYQQTVPDCDKDKVYKVYETF